MKGVVKKWITRSESFAVNRSAEDEELYLKPSPPTEWANLYQRHIISLRPINRLDINLTERQEDSRTLAG